MTFTRAAILDHRIETLAVTLDNALVDHRYWLPHHQELDVVRSVTWLDYPVRGIIRTRWQICCYRINRGLRCHAFAGRDHRLRPPPSSRRYPWPGEILDSLPSDVSVATAGRCRAEQRRPGAIVRVRRSRGCERPRSRHPASRTSCASIESRGCALGGQHDVPWTPHGRSRAAGATGLPTSREGRGGHRVAARGGVGAPPGLPAVIATTGDIAEGSTLVNSIAAQEFGADHTDPYDTRGVGLASTLDRPARAPLALSRSRETQRALAVHAAPVDGRLRSDDSGVGTAGDARRCRSVARPEPRGRAGIDLAAHAELRGEWYYGAPTPALAARVTVAGLRG